MTSNNLCVCVNIATHAACVYNKLLAGITPCLCKASTGAGNCVWGAKGAGSSAGVFRWHRATLCLVPAQGIARSLCADDFASRWLWHWTQPYSILCLGMSGLETSPCQHLVVCKSNSVLQEVIGRKASLCSPWGRWRIQPLSASRPRGPQKGICGGIALPATWHLLGIGKRSWQQGEHFFVIMVVQLPGQLEESRALVGVWSWSKWWGEVSIAFCRYVVLQALLAQYCK